MIDRPEGRSNRLVRGRGVVSYGCKQTDRLAVQFGVSATRYKVQWW
jgi:hypothetical protein